MRACEQRMAERRNTDNKAYTTTERSLLREMPSVFTRPVKTV